MEKLFQFPEFSLLSNHCSLFFLPPSVPEGSFKIYYHFLCIKQVTFFNPKSLDEEKKQMLAQATNFRGPSHNSLEIKVIRVCLKSFIKILLRHNDVTDKTHWLGQAATFSLPWGFLPSQCTSLRMEFLKKKIKIILCNTYNSRHSSPTSSLSC